MVGLGPDCSLKAFPARDSNEDLAWVYVDRLGPSRWCTVTNTRIPYSAAVSTYSYVRLYLDLCRGHGRGRRPSSYWLPVAPRLSPSPPGPRLRRPIAPTASTPPSHYCGQHLNTKVKKLKPSPHVANHVTFFWLPISRAATNSNRPLTTTK